MSKHINAGITLFNKTKVKPGAFKIKENYGSQTNKLAAKDGSKQNNPLIGEEDQRDPLDIHLAETSTRPKTINTGIAMFDDVTLDSGAFEIGKNFGHKENEIITSEGITFRNYPFLNILNTLTLIFNYLHFIQSISFKIHV